jgi:ribosome biogenesis GTPase
MIKLINFTLYERNDKMPHYNTYDSFKTKKSIEKKQRAKEKTFGKKNETIDNFIIDSCDEYGVVIEVRYDDAYVLYNGEIVLAKLRKDINLVCNQVVFPGDKVDIEKLNDIYIINHLLNRTSILSRTKKDSTRLNDVGLTKNIAANVDLAVIVVAAKEPPLHPKFIDRYLMILQNSNIPAIICLNKYDLKSDEDEEILSTYRNLGIMVIETSTYSGIGINELKTQLMNKQAIFVGNSGVGKSSLTNAIMGDDEIKTSHISDKSKRGRHTTTTSKYYVWEENSSIIDTPGIRSLDVSSFNPIEIQDYFPEFENWKDKCKYNDCLHFNEPYDSCIVKQGVSSGLISVDRYESYLRIMSDVLSAKDYSEILGSVKPETVKKKSR